MTEADILDAVSEAIWLVDAPGYANGVVPWENVTPGDRRRVQDKARAAIRTMREIGLEACMGGE